MNDEESGTIQPPRPVPISSINDLAMPKFATLGFWVRSGICARAAVPYLRVTIAPASSIKTVAIFIFDGYFIIPPLARITLMNGANRIVKKSANEMGITWRFTAEKFRILAFARCGKIAAPLT
jgi:hypothetical protein